MWWHLILNVSKVLILILNFGKKFIILRCLTKAALLPNFVRGRLVSTPFLLLTALLRKSHLCMPRKGTKRPQSQFPQACVCEWFIYSQDRSAFCCSNICGPIVVGIFKWLTDTWMWKLGLRPRNSFPGKIFFRFSVLCLCSVAQLWLTNKLSRIRINFVLSALNFDFQFKKAT